MDSLCKKSATELAKLIRDGEVTSRDVVAAHLDRIDEVNPAINAVTLVLAESALDQADKADHAGPERGSDRFMVFPLLSRRILTSLVHRRHRVSRHLQTPCQRVTRRSSIGCWQREQYRSGEPIFLKWALAWIPTTPCEVELTTPGIGTSLREVPVVGRQLPLQRG